MNAEQRRYQIFLRSSVGPIEVFLISHLDEQPSSQEAPPEQEVDPQLKLQQAMPNQQLPNPSLSPTGPGPA